MLSLACTDNERHCHRIIQNDKIFECSSQRATATIDAIYDDFHVVDVDISTRASRAAEWSEGDESANRIVHFPFRCWPRYCIRRRFSRRNTNVTSTSIIIVLYNATTYCKWKTLESIVFVLEHFCAAN